MKLPKSHRRSAGGISGRSRKQQTRCQTATSCNNPAPFSNAKKNLNGIDLKNLFRLALFPKRGDAPSSAWGRAHADVRPWCGKWGCGQGACREGERGSRAGGRAAGPAALPRPPFRGAQRVTAWGRAGDGNLLPSLLPARDQAPQVHGN